MKVSDRDMDWISILLYILCGCCAFLCCVVVFLCITVRRIRRDLNELARNGNIIYTEPMESDIKGRKDNDETNRKRMSSSANRYTVEPGQAKPPNRLSAIHIAPDETVTYLPRPGEEIAAQNDASTHETIALGCVNQSFQPGANADEGRPTTGSDNACENDQPICPDTNGEEIYENQGLDEPIYVNRGEMADLNNPEMPDRSYTMDISELR